MEERELLSKEQYYSKIARQSTLSARNHKTAVKAFEGFFIHYTLQINEQPLKILADFTDYLVKQNLHPRTISGYVNRVRKYFRLCHGIKLDDDDFKDFLSLPNNFVISGIGIRYESLNLIGVTRSSCLSMMNTPGSTAFTGLVFENRAI